MTVENKPLYDVLKRVLISNLLLFLCSIPIFYLMISHDITGTEFPYAYMIARILRFLLVIAIGYVIRKRYQTVLAHCVLLKRKLMHIIFGCIIVGACSLLSNFTPKLYLTISHSIGIYNQEATPLFLAVLWEQLFAGDLFWSILLCLAFVFFICKRPAKGECGEIV